MFYVKNEQIEKIKADHEIELNKIRSEYEIELNKIRNTSLMKDQEIDFLRIGFRSYIESLKKRDEASTHLLNYAKDILIQAVNKK